MLETAYEKAIDAHRTIRRIKGVHSASVQPHTGSLIIHYCPHRLAPAQLEEQLRKAGFLGQSIARVELTGRSADEMTRGLVSQLGRSLAGAIVEKVIERALFAAFI
jgi:hypothetical protein